MSATDELRRMLDERGVEWEAPTSFDGTARYDTVAGGYWFHEFNGKITIHGLDPEQAIAATLGRGVLSASQVSNAVYAHSIHADCADADWQAIADELNATLGRGTCHITDSGPWGHPYVCSACGASFDPEVYDGEFNYCPNCGRHIVEVDE